MNPYDEPTHIARVEEPYKFDWLIIAQAFALYLATSVFVYTVTWFVTVPYNLVTNLALISPWIVGAVYLALRVKHTRVAYWQAYALMTALGSFVTQLIVSTYKGKSLSHYLVLDLLILLLESSVITFLSMGITFLVLKQFDNQNKPVE